MKNDKKFKQESDKFWKDIIYIKSGKNKGKLNEKQVLKELSDYYFVMQEVPKVFCHITNNAMSKINYYASEVISVVDDVLNHLILEDRKCK